jgi:hypothetical protein
MSRRSPLLAGLGGLAMALLLLVPARAQISISDYSPEVTVEGLVGTPRTYTLDALRRLPVTDVAIQGIDDAVTRGYRGVSLYDLLVDANPLFDPARPTDALNWYVLVSAGDDRSAVVAWGEIDPSFEGKPVIVACSRGTWTAIDADTKLMPSWFVGGRDSDSAIVFMDDLRSRLQP